jgi:hypothetical protein
VLEGFAKVEVAVTYGIGRLTGRRANFARSRVRQIVDRSAATSMGKALQIGTAAGMVLHPGDRSGDGSFGISRKTR